MCDGNSQYSWCTRAQNSPAVSIKGESALLVDIHGSLDGVALAVSRIGALNDIPGVELGRGTKCVLATGEAQG